MYQKNIKGLAIITCIPFLRSPHGNSTVTFIELAYIGRLSDHGQDSCHIRGNQWRTRAEDIAFSSNCIPVQLAITVQSKYPVTYLSARRNSMDQSIKTSVNVICFEFEVGKFDVICCPSGILSPADLGTKTAVLSVNLFNY